jgi:UDP-N-acetylmuramoyl-L-alanyl-D-glutamate--2,6-diaminopimelate ligase
LICLRDLLPESRIDREEVAALQIAGIAADSRQVRPGFAFFALPGAKADGLGYAREAQARGAVAIVAHRLDPSVELSVPAVVVADVRRALSVAAAIFHPRQPATIAAVTGTSGKTSVAAFTRQIWAGLGHSAAAIGTTGVVTPAGEAYGQLTTPDPVTLHRTLDQLAGQGVTHLVLEASSHGLDQRRLDGVRLRAGAFTNLSRDHLDYHATLGDYLKAKLRLFESLLAPGQAAVIDVDGEYGRRVAAACKTRGLRVMETGRGGADLRLVRIEPREDGARLTLDVQGRRRTADLPLAGDFMASNALVAAGLCMATGSEAEAVLAGVASLKGAPGRLERIGARRGAPIFVDYAHKPDALEKVLRALRPLARRRLVVVFGCGGDRDPGKRPIMGAIAVREADAVIVTDDNPRSENPAAIRAAILAAAPGAREIGDRRTAIIEAVRALEAGDVLVVAGKGHETGQIVGDRTLPFSDQEEIRRAIKEADS